MTIDNRAPSPKRQVRNLLSVLSFSILSAFLIAGLLLYAYGPSGRYLVKQALLSPDLMTSLNFNDSNHKTGGMSRFVFDGIELSLYDSQTKKMQNKPISLDGYKKFYELVANEKSLKSPPEEVESSFRKMPIASLLINIRTDSHAAWQDETKIFQEINFLVEGDYFRIELREEQNSGGNWAYYYYPGIYQKALNLLSLWTK